MRDTVAGGKADETISARSGRAAAQGKLWGKGMARFLNLFQKDHCAKAAAGDDARGKNISKVEKDSGLISPK